MTRLSGLAAVALVASSLGVPACAPSVPDTSVPPVAEPGRPVFEAEVRPDPASGTLAADWTIGFIAERGDPRPVSFILAQGLEIERLEGRGIRGYGEEPSPFNPGWKLVVLELEEDREDVPVLMELRYRGTPDLPETRINQVSPDWVELSVDSGWHPLFATFDQEMRGVLRVVLPSDWTVSGGGSVSFEDGRHVVRRTEPQLDVAFVAAPELERIEGQRTSLLHRGGDPETVRAVLDAAESCAAYLDARYGRDDPLPHTTLVLAARPANAYARIGQIVLSEVDPSDGPGLSRFLCHELSHYWSRGADFTTAHHWMSEAFAEYVGARYVRDRYGQEVFDGLIERWEGVSRDQGPVWTEEMTARGGDVLMYRKAPVLLSRLEERIGPEAFDTFLERYMTREVDTTQELLRRLEAVAGPENARWFHELLACGPGGETAEGPGEGPGSHP